jgi:hypothetical protein
MGSASSPRFGDLIRLWLPDPPGVKPPWADVNFETCAAPLSYAACAD